MSSITRVSPTEMFHTAKLIEEAIQRWQFNVNEIYKLQSELDYMWDGDANSAFNRQWEEDRAKFNKLTSMMNEYKSAIEAAAKLYRQKESEVVGIMNSGIVTGNVGFEIIYPDKIPTGLLPLGPAPHPDDWQDWFGVSNVSPEGDIDSISGAIED